MEKFDTNPFDRSALNDPRLLAGRTNEFRIIKQLLRNSISQKDRIKSLLISGDRGVGKTSFLNLIEQECHQNNIIAVRLNITKTNSTNPNEFFWYLFNQILNKVYEFDLLGGKNGLVDCAIQKILHSEGLSDIVNYTLNTPVLRKNYLVNNNAIFEFDQLVLDLKKIRKEVTESEGTKFNEKTKFIFLVDESQNIYSNINIVEDLRYIIQHQDLGIGFVFAGDTTYKSSKWEEVFGGTHRDFEVINLNYFIDSVDVKDYFIKSLESIGWTSKEIEETLFYRFNLACRQIFYLTSGKPAWINIIASKMFERCMNGESKILTFDKQAQNDVKHILGSNEIDKVKLEFIDNLPPAHKNWLSELFASELSTLREVYFYGKYTLSDDYISLEDYTNFCKHLVEKKIIVLFEKVQKLNIGYSNNTTTFIDNRYVSFGYDSDTIKQWLQISSDGRYRFQGIDPSLRYFANINKRLLSEDEKNVNIFFEKTDNDIQLTRISEIIKSINDNNYVIEDESFKKINEIYKLCKLLDNSKERFVLFGILADENSGVVRVWNAYNYNDKNHLISFSKSPINENKFKNIVEKFNDNSSRYSLQLNIDRIDKPNIEQFQQMIIKSGDSKKLGIILEDKMEDLINFYIKKSDINASIKIAQYVYNLFIDGHDLSIKDLNNTAYVFLSNDELDKSISLLQDAKSKRLNRIYDQDFNNSGTSILVNYNLAIIKAKKLNFKGANKIFTSIIMEYNSIDKIDYSATALFVLELDDNQNIIIIEIKEGNEKYPKINTYDFAKINIANIEKSIHKNLIEQ